MPESHTKWGIALHACMCVWPRMAPCGLCTFLQVIIGSVVLYVGKPAGGDVVNQDGLDAASFVWQGLKMNSGDTL